MPSLSLAETIRAVAAGKSLTEAGAVPFTQANQPAGDAGGGGQAPIPNSGPTGMPAEEPDLAGQQVVQAELILIADRAQKIAALAGQGAAMDPMLQTQITGIASDISQLYADLMMASMPDPNADPNASAGAAAAGAGGSQVNTNPKVAEEALFEMFGCKGNEAVQAAYDALKKKPLEKKDLKAPGVRTPQDKIKEEELDENENCTHHLVGATKEGLTQKQFIASKTKYKSAKEAEGALADWKAKHNLIHAEVRRVNEAVAPAPADDAEDEGNEHIIMQLHKSVTLGGKKLVKFASGQKVKVDPKDAHKALQKFQNMKPMEKAKAQEYLRQSHNNLKAFVAEDFEMVEEEELQERVIKAEPHFIDSLESAMGTNNGKEVEFENGQKVTIPPHVAKKIVEKFRGSSAYDKQQLNKYVRASYANLVRAAR